KGEPCAAGGSEWGRAMTAERPSQLVGPIRPMRASPSYSPNSRLHTETAFSSKRRPGSSTKKARKKALGLWALATTRPPERMAKVPSRTRIRDLTEEEYQYAQAAKWRQATAFFVMFSSSA